MPAAASASGACGTGRSSSSMINRFSKQTTAEIKIVAGLGVVPAFLLKGALCYIGHKS